MSKYQLIAFDMDGTLLNSEKKISKDTLLAIEEAFDAGKEIALSTGRCVVELEEYFSQIPRLRYLICTSGALVYDLKEKTTIYAKKLSADVVQKILEVGKEELCMEHILTVDSIVQAEKISCMETYNMGHHQPMFERVATGVENIREWYRQYHLPVEKAILHHASTEGRKRSRERLKELDIEMVDSEVASLECSAKGVTKGIGLEKLCEYLGISVEETIAVGDADNDLDILKHAGLSIAMGNGNERVKEIADIIVRDCDHDGCAQAIREYLL